jgi:hypothetical protein
MVYLHFWDEETVHALPLARVLESGGVLTKIPQIADKKLFGEQIAAEAVDWLYNNSLHLTINPPSSDAMVVAEDVEPSDVTDLMGEPYLAWEDALHGVLRSSTVSQIQISQERRGVMSFIC